MRHSLNKSCYIIYCILENKLIWNFNPNASTVCQEMHLKMPSKCRSFCSNFKAKTHRKEYKGNRHLCSCPPWPWPSGTLRACAGWWARPEVCCRPQWGRSLGRSNPAERSTENTIPLQVICLPVRANYRFVPSQWETALLCNDVSHWLGANLESALPVIRTEQGSVSGFWKTVVYIQLSRYVSHYVQTNKNMKIKFFLTV